MSGFNFLEELTLNSVRSHICLCQESGGGLQQVIDRATYFVNGGGAYPAEAYVV